MGAGRIQFALLAVAGFGCQSSPSTTPPTDLPFDVEPVELASPDGGATVEGVRFAISLQIGDAAPVRGLVDTGSSGIVMSPSAPADTLAAVTATSTPIALTYGSGVTASGVMGTARVTLGDRATDAPIGVALIQQLTGGTNDVASLEQQLFNGYSAIVGVGMRNTTSTLGNPIVQLSGHPDFVVEAPDFGGTTGTLRVGPTAGDLQGFKILDLARAGGTFPALADGTPAWEDDDLPGCVANDDSQEELCAPTLLDTGDPQVYLYWPGYSGVAPLPAGTTIGVEVGPSATADSLFSLTVGSTPQAGLDLFNPVPSSVSHISLGTLFFFRSDVAFSQSTGHIGFLLHAGQAGTVGAVPAPCNVTYDCPAGQTCWTQDATNWSCLPDGTSTPGAPCNSETTATLTCGDHLACVALGGNPLAGECLRWCSAADPCPSDAGACQTLTTTGGAKLSFCM